MAAVGPHISISAELLFTVGALHVTNSMITSVVVSSLLILFGVWVRMSMRKTNRPTGVQNVAEWMIEGLISLVHSVTNNKARTDVFFPVIASFFLIIVSNNWFGLIPGVGTIMVAAEGQHSEKVVLAPSNITIKNAATVVQASEVAPTEVGHSESTEPAEATLTKESSTEVAGEHTEESAETTEHEEKELAPLFRAGTADLNMTLALGILSVGLTQYYGLKFLKLSYLKKYINFSSPINFFVGILEIVLELAKIVSFAFRLFGNIFAGEVLLAVIGFLVAVIAPMPFYGLELFVGFIQALVFSMLSVVMFNMATISHDEHEG